MSQLQPVADDRIALNPENLQSLMARPLLAVPAELRPACWSIWLLNQSLFSNPLGISGAVATDLARGLTVEDATAILSAMADPDVRKTFKFATDFTCEFARRSSLAIAQREKIRKQLELREALSGPATTENAAKADGIIKAIAAGMSV